MKKILKVAMCLAMCLMVIINSKTNVSAQNDKTEVMPRFVETFTETGYTYIGDGYVKWNCVVSHDSRTNVWKLQSVSNSVNFPSNPTYMVSSYSTNPSVGGVISGNVIKITFRIFVLPGISTGPHTCTLTI